MTKPINWIIDVDIKGFFDNVDHHWMIECLEQRISDPRFKTLIIKFLKAGAISEGKYNKTEKGTPQGGILSPLLANIYLHYALDLWFEKIEKKKIKGYTQIIRYADDFIIGAQTKEEAKNKVLIGMNLTDIQNYTPCQNRLLRLICMTFGKYIDGEPCAGKPPARFN
ncbi:hypothetical protein KAI65_00795 [Candidatus Parcubacteria bacterium]|nr:hypothetical protein [Candidatus Parcubacteria bacterium]